MVFIVFSVYKSACRDKDLVISFVTADFSQHTLPDTGKARSILKAREGSKLTKQFEFGNYGKDASDINIFPYPLVCIIWSVWTEPDSKKIQESIGKLHSDRL